MSKPILRTRFQVLIIGALLSGCATTSMTSSGTSDTLSLSLDAPATWQSARSPALPMDANASQAPWLSGFSETVWAELVNTAYQNNPDLDGLQANLDRAGALSDRARSGLRPVLDGILGLSRSDNLEGPDASSATLGASIAASWEPDVWGRLKASVQAGDFETEAARADLYAARQILAASVVESAFLAIEANSLAQVAQSNLDALSETLGFVEVQYERGLRSAQDLVLIRADVASATASLRQAEGSARAAQRALDVLIGDYPDTNRVLQSELPVVPRLSAMGQPTDILRNRPDLRAAELRVDATYSRQESALAAQKPRLTLGGTFGGSDAQLGQLLDPASLAATLFANVAAPLYDGGQRSADVAVAQADVDSALATYRRTALDAFQDVENQIDQGTILQEREDALFSALQDARNALKFTRFRYESAEVDLLNVLQVQQRVSFIEAQLVSLRRARLSQYVNLSLALGVPPSTGE